MTEQHIARARVEVNAPAERVWEALTSTDLIAQWMLGARVESDWAPGSVIIWSGEMAGRPFRDTGEVLTVDRPRRLTITHMSGTDAQDASPATHTIVHELDEQAGRTVLTLTQDNNASQEAAHESSGRWASMLAELKVVVERGETDGRSA